MENLPSGIEQDDAPAVIFYTRPGCHLCDRIRPRVAELAAEYGVPMRIRNVEADPRWEQQFGTQIPVVFVDGTKACKYRLDESRLRRLLDATTNA